MKKWGLEWEEELEELKGGVPIIALNDTRGGCVRSDF